MSSTPTPVDLSEVPADVLEAALAERRAETSAAEGAAGVRLAAAVRRFLDLPTVARGIAADPAWDNEWLGGANGLRVGDVRGLHTALAAFDAAATE